MSRVGKAKISKAAGVDVAVAGSEVTVKGPKGQLTLALVDGMDVAVEGDVIAVTRNSDHRQVRALHGMTRSLISNMVTGVTKGFTKSLEIRGVGFKAQQKGSSNLEMSVGKSHTVMLPIPDGVKLDVSKDGRSVIVNGIDKQLVGETAAKIRATHKPEPYKGKGIRYVGEYVRSKEGKTGK
jgi:large subunit ribosomal protein L6